MLDLRKSFCLSDTIVLRGLANKFWALDIVSGNQYKLNEVSYFILNLLRIPMAVEQLIEEIRKVYEVAYEQVVADCFIVLQFAKEKNIIKEVTA